MKKQNELLLKLSLAPGVGPVTIQRVLEGIAYRKVTIEALQSLSVAELLHFGLSQGQSERVYEALRDDVVYQKECALLDKYQIAVVTIVDEQYPDLLRHIPYPPAVLYVNGDVAVLQQQAYAVVGARKGDAYGKRAVDRLVPSLVQAGICIVSGGARGIDSFAHQATLNHGGCTIAVLGSGILQPYPRENIPMFEQIVATGGAIISPFPLMTAPHPGNFPARNRIISGLCEALIVVQGERKSGAGITATFALEQGKTIYAVPGSIESSLSELPHYLIGQGAMLCDSPKSFGFEPIIQNKVTEPTNKPLTLEDQLIALCSEPQTFEQLQQALKLDEDALHQLLFEVQCSARIKQDFIGRYSAL